MTITAGLEVAMDQLEAVCLRYNVQELSIFGSAARGELRDDSDVGLLVVFKPDTRIGWEFFDLELELARVMGRKVDLGTKRSLKPWVRDNVLRDARVIFAA